VWVRALTLRDFRCYEQAQAAFGESVTVVCGPNGAGKTNLLEALYFGCTGRSCRTSNERELIRFGATATRVTVTVQAPDGEHELAVGFAPGEPKRMRADGAPVERLLDVEQRPLMCVFMPDRLELIKGAPGVRRAHLDQFVAAMWPTRVATRRAYAQALAHRNALLVRVRAGHASRESLSTWNAQLATHGIALMADRAAAVDAISAPFTAIAAQLGLDGGAAVTYRPRSGAEDPPALAAELAARADGDVDRGYTTHGPHRDELVALRGGRELRAYGSQGQQRLALLALLLAERDAIASYRQAPPMMLLDDVMSELDRERRQALVELLCATAGQAVITTTDIAHVPGASDAGMARVSVDGGRVLDEVLAP
jgi:DNA replication and repair protein RecF